MRRSLMLIREGRGWGFSDGFLSEDFIEPSDGEGFLAQQ